MPIPTWTEARSDIARAVKRGDQEGATEARRELVAARMRDAVAKALASDAPPTFDQLGEVEAMICAAMDRPKISRDANGATSYTTTDDKGFSRYLTPPDCRH